MTPIHPTRRVAPGPMPFKPRVVPLVVVTVVATWLTAMAQTPTPPPADAPQPAGATASPRRSNRPGAARRPRAGGRRARQRSLRRCGPVSEGAGHAGDARRAAEAVLAVPPGSRWSRSSPIPTSRSRRRSPSTATAGCSCSRFAATCRTPTRPASSIRSAASRCTRTPTTTAVYEKHSVFVDKLVFPRFVMPFGANAILTKESNADEVWKYTDTNNDGVADKKELFATGFGRAGNVEHQQSGLFWAHGQLDVQHRQRLPRALDAERRLQGADRRQQRAVGRHAGQLRQGLVPGRRQRHARLLPVPGRLRQLQRSAADQQFEPDFEHHLGRAGASPTCRAGIGAIRCPTAR